MTRAWCLPELELLNSAIEQLAVRMKAARTMAAVASLLDDELDAAAALYEEVNA